MADWKLGDLFTQAEIDRAGKLYAECGPGRFATRCAAEIVGPALPRINEVTGQENDARYMAYMLEHALSQAMSAPTAPGRH